VGRCALETESCVPDRMSTYGPREGFRRLVRCVLFCCYPNGWPVSCFAAGRSPGQRDRWLSDCVMFISSRWAATKGHYSCPASEASTSASAVSGSNLPEGLIAGLLWAPMLCFINEFH
jgi:hypothetical protein